MEEQRFRRKISIGGRSLVNAFQVKCRTCSALVMMDQDPTTKKWRPMDEKDGQLVPHWPACEENLRQRAIAKAKEARRKAWLADHPEVGEKARKARVRKRESQELETAFVRAVREPERLRG